MKLRTLIFPVALLLAFMVSCKEQPGRSRVIILQPFTDMPSDLSQSVYDQLKLINPNTFLQKPIELPEHAYNHERGRYRADSIIKFINYYASTDTVIVGLTAKDISTTKGSVADWGVMGLGYEPGNACVVSAFRVYRANLPEQFYKVVLHELGHTQGLPHCPNHICLMRDAEGSNHLEEEIGFCASCKKILQSKGWILN